MISKEDRKTIQAMETYGGSFFKALAVAFTRADKENFQRLKTAFAKQFEQYREIGKRRL